MIYAYKWVNSSQWHCI